jgi:phospholipase/carboxylesterase
MGEEEILDATAALVPPLLTALEALAYASRHLHPPNLRGVAGAIEEFAGPLETARAAFDAVDWPERLSFFRNQLVTAGDATAKALDGVTGAEPDQGGIMRAYRAMRHRTRAVEALYPLTYALPTVSRFFLEPEHRHDEALLKLLAEADGSLPEVGVMNANNGLEERGGFTLYVPEYYDPGKAWPVVVALHGGSGHGADFLWTWLTEARTRGAIVVSPTAQGDTWSLYEPGVDIARLDGIVAHLKDHWNVDAERVLLTGMSDGGTFSWLGGLRDSAPYTHLAPISSSFHPMLLAEAGGVAGKPIYLVHGALDWMFPIDMARGAAEALTDAGADVVFREIDDLSHTYPREENALILDWFL